MGIEAVTKFIPYAWKAWLRSRLIPPIHLMKYHPYQGNAFSYAIGQSDSEHKEMCKLGLPIPPRSLWAGYEEYLESGERDVGRMTSILDEAGFSLTMGCRILDFGCASGRMIRWLKDKATTCEIWGTDISSEHAIWCKLNLSPPFSFITTTTFPHLPFEDRYFDLVYAGSVFTHIDDLADAWFLELRRITKIGGSLYITILDKNSLRILKAEMPDARLSKLIESNKTHLRYAESNFGMFTIGRHSSANVFYDIDYLCRMLRTSFEVLSITKEAYGFQTAVLFARR